MEDKTHSDVMSDIFAVIPVRTHFLLNFMYVYFSGAFGTLGEFCIVWNIINETSAIPLY